MTTLLHWGILGTGMIARKFAGELPQTDRAKLVAVGSRSAANAGTFCDELGGAPRDSYEALLADRDVEAVYISLPNSLHHPWTIRALEAGKHVLCEKPLAATAASGAEMFAVAQRTGRTLMEAFMYRHHPAIKKFIATIRGGAVGQVKLIRTHFTFNRPASASDVRYQAGLAGGSLMDVGCYCLNFARALAGEEPTSIFATAHLHELGVDDYAAGALKFNNDILCSFTCGMTVEADRTTYVCGTDGYAQIDTPWFCNGEFTIVKGDKREIVREPAPMGLYAMEAEALAAVVQDGTPPVITQADSLGNLRVLDELRNQMGLVR